MARDDFTNEAELRWRDPAHQEEKQEWMITWVGSVDLQGKEINREHKQELNNNPSFTLLCVFSCSFN